MAKKHIRNQSTSPSTCLVLSSKEPAGTTSHQKQESLVRCTKTAQDTCLSHARANQLSKNAFQFVKTRFEESTNSLPRQLQTTTATGSEPACQYHYYQTSTNRWINQTEYKHQNINCWLENVLKNNQNEREENEDFETEQITHGQEEDQLSIDDSSASSLPRAKRYKPYHACAKRDLINGNETNCRQDKIRTLTTLITRHDEHINGLKLCRNIDINKQRQNNGKKTVRGPERGKNCQSNSSKSKTNSKPAKEKKTSFDIRNPNSIFFAVLEEEQIARRRSIGGLSCCASETLTGQQDELRVELKNISAS